jgi:hypothetical protein
MINNIANFARPEGAKDKKPRRRRRKNALVSAAKGAALGAGLIGAGLTANNVRKALSFAPNAGNSVEVIRQALQATARGGRNLAALGAGGLAGAGAAYLRRSGINREIEQDEYDSKNLLQKWRYNRRLKRERRLKQERRRDFDNRKKDIIDAVGAVTSSSGEARRWKSLINSEKARRERGL